MIMKKKCKKKFNCKKVLYICLYMYNKIKKFNIILEKMLVFLILLIKNLIILCLLKFYLYYILRYVDLYK